MNNKTPHKHAALIKAWADGAQIERKNSRGDWFYVYAPDWDVDEEYRIQPEPKIEIKRIFVSLNENSLSGIFMIASSKDYQPNIRIWFDSETKKPIGVDLLDGEN